MSDRERAKIKISLVSKGARSSLEGFVTPEQWGQIVATVNGQPAQATPVGPVARLTDAEIEQGRQEIFSVNNPYCPCDIKTMQKAVRWAERTIAARTTTPPASLT